jgi:hypothetical protein
VHKADKKREKIVAQSVQVKSRAGQGVAECPVTYSIYPRCRTKKKKKKQLGVSMAIFGFFGFYPQTLA